FALGSGEIGAKPRRTTLYFPGTVFDATVISITCSSLPGAMLSAGTVMPLGKSPGTAAYWKLPLNSGCTRVNLAVILILSPSEPTGLCGVTLKRAGALPRIARHRARSRRVTVGIGC